MQTLLPLVREYGTKKAKAWLEGYEELAVADDDLTSFLARHDVEWHELQTTDQDSVRDAYLEAVKAAFRPAGSDSVHLQVIPVPEVWASLQPFMQYVEGLEDGPHKRAMVKAKNLLVYGIEDPALLKCGDMTAADLRSLLVEARAALKPFAHEDLSERAPSMPMDDASPVYGRNKALLLLGDFRRAKSTLTKLQSFKA